MLVLQNVCQNRHIELHNPFRGSSVFAESFQLEMKLSCISL